MEDIVPYTFSVVGEQDALRVWLSRGLLVIVAWLLWSVPLHLLFWAIIVVREGLVMRDRGLYAYCFPRHLPAEQGEVFAVKPWPAHWFGTPKRRSWARATADPLASLVSFFFVRFRRKNLPWRNLAKAAVDHGLPVGLEIRHLLFRRGLWVRFSFEERISSEAMVWRQKEGTLRPLKDLDVGFNDRYKIKLKVA